MGIIKTLKEAPSYDPLKTAEVELPGGVVVVMRELPGFEMADFWRWVVDDKARTDKMFFRLAAMCLDVEEDVEDRFSWICGLRDSEGVLELLTTARELNGLGDEEVEAEKKP